MATADELPAAIRPQQEQEKRHKLRRQGSLAKQLVHMVQSLLQRSLRPKLHAESAQHHRAQQCSENSLSGDVCQDADPFIRIEFPKVVEIAADIARRVVERM